MSARRKLTIGEHTGDNHSGKYHYYDVELAIDLGHDVHAAILFQHLAYCISNNKQCKTDEEGNVWYKASATDIATYLPDFTPKMIENSKKRLIAAGLIVQQIDQWKNSYTLTPSGWAYTKYQSNGSNTEVIKKTKVIEVAPEVREVIEYLNKEIGRNRRPESKSSREGIEHWLEQGISVEELKAVIDVKKPQWIDTPKSKMWLRPETLFGDRFEGYLEEARDAGLVEITPVELTTDAIQKYVNTTDMLQYYKKDIDQFTPETQERIEALFDKRRDK